MTNGFPDQTPVALDIPSIGVHAETIVDLGLALDLALSRRRVEYTARDARKCLSGTGFLDFEVSMA